MSSEDETKNDLLRAAKAKGHHSSFRDVNRSAEPITQHSEAKEASVNADDFIKKLQRESPRPSSSPMRKLVL